MKKKLIIVLHLLFIIVAYTSPFWLDWRLVIIGAVLYWVQLMVFKACILSIAEYGNTETSFVAVNVNKLLSKVIGKEIAINKIKVVLDWLPLFFVIAAYILQNYLNVTPLLKL